MTHSRRPYWPPRVAATALGVFVLSLAYMSPVAFGQEVESSGGLAIEEFGVPRGSRPHDAVPDRHSVVWYAAQRSGELGRFDPATGELQHVWLGRGSAPHGVIIGPDGAPWLTDGGLNAIVRVDPGNLEVQVFPVPGARANLNTATFDARGVLWFTGQNGVIGRLDPAVGIVEAFPAPRGRGPYGIATTPDGSVYFVSLAGNYLGRIDSDNGAVTILEPPTANQGARRVWSDSEGRLWISEYNAGQVARYDPATAQWREWPLPGSAPRAYSVYVDERDVVWLSDFGSDSLVRFEPQTETFTTIQLTRPALVRQLGGRPGEVWGAESGRDHLVVVRSD